ncbi:MAG: hypothetical protein QOD60_1521 [Solirubrobacterales bacterium]|jgi:hypothetical protein|nr:hypothetical protein [Solirubrobacterales bacterium]
MAQQRRSSSAGGARKRGTTARKKPSSRRGATRGTAPSAPDTSKLKLLTPSKAAQEHEPSTVDAMGKDKRREVIGHAYGPSRRSQLAVLGGFIAVVLIVVFGLGAIARDADKTPKSNPDLAPWGQPSAPQTPAVRPE